MISYEPEAKYHIIRRGRSGEVIEVCRDIVGFSEVQRSVARLKMGRDGEDLEVVQVCARTAKK